MVRKPFLAAGIATVVVAGGIMFLPHSANSTFDIDGLNQQVQNHEARITNAENDVKDLQTTTGTPPSANRQTVPAPATPSAATPQPSPSPTPEPVVVQKHVTKSVQNPCTPELNGSDPGYTDYWSDGTTTQRFMPGSTVCIYN